MSTLFRGVLLLAGAAFISECIEFFINLVLAKELGEYGLGQYMSIVPWVGMIMIVASIELDVSVSKLVAERDQKDRYFLLRTAFKFAMMIAGGLLFLTTTLFYFFPVFINYHPYIRWSLLVLVPIVSLMSVVRGYFIGVQKMEKIAVSNLFRRGMQLFLLVIIFRLFDFSLDVSIFVALCAVVAGELLVFTYLFTAYFVQIKFLKGMPKGQDQSRKSLIKGLLQVSLPTTMTRFFHSIAHVIQPILIKQTLAAGGLTIKNATEQFGLIAGVAMPIGFFPAFIAYSMMTALLPAVSKAYAMRDQSQLLKMLRQFMWWTLAYGLPVSIVFFIFAEKFTGLFVPSLAAPYYLQLLVPYFMLHYFSIPMQAFLIGIGLVKDAFIHNIWSSLFSFAIIYLLGSNSQFLMDGVIIGMNTGALLLMLLHYFTICKKLGFTIALSKKERMLI